MLRIPNPEGDAMRSRSLLNAAAIAVVLAAATLQGQQQKEDGGSFKFKTGVELINVTASVSDGTGRFVRGLAKDDFTIYEDGQRQEITHFSSDRTPVSLGVVLDTSDSMDGEKIQAAKAALNRFLFDLLDPQDEIFLYTFDDDPRLLQGWTTDRQALSRAINRIRTDGATAMYDAVAEAIPLAVTGRHQKKAIVLISDGNDTSSRTPLVDLKQLVRESEVIVYAIGIDGESRSVFSPGSQPRPPVRMPPMPIPFPGGPRRPGGRFEMQWPPRPGPPGGSHDRVNSVALRDLTDDSGGRTEIIREPRDLNPATEGIASELSQQYYIGYPAPGKRDGRWHSIRVEVNNRNYRVRARRGYVAS
jgi:Ca-activated chloride channel family protein